MRRIVFIVVAALMFCTLFAGCTQPAEQAQTEKQDVISSEAAPKTPEKEAGEGARQTAADRLCSAAHRSSCLARCKQGFEDAARDLGFEGQVGPSTNDVNEVVKQIEIAIAAKADGIITYGAAPDAMQPVLQRAADEGIPAVCVIGDVLNVDKLGFMGTDPQNFGETGARVLSEKWVTKRSTL